MFSACTALRQQQHPGTALPRPAQQSWPTVVLELALHTPAFHACPAPVDIGDQLARFVPSLLDYRGLFRLQCRSSMSLDLSPKRRPTVRVWPKPS